MSYSAFGSYIRPGDVLSVEWLGQYVVNIRCDAGCHAARHLIDPDYLPEFWPSLIDLVDRAYGQAHPNV